MKKNVLLLCLSPVKPQAQTAEYCYTLKNGQTVTFTGSMTNEAPAKCVIDTVNRYEIGGKLDRVVMICSSKLSGSIDPSSPISHIDYYKSAVKDFALQTDPVYREKAIEFTEIPVEDYTESNAVSLAAVRAAEEILSLSPDGEEINLYIDFNGGQRYFALMLLAVSNIMKQHAVNVSKVLTMNYENRIDGKVQIQNLTPVLGCIDLVSATNEYINYGKTASLRAYFAEAMKQDKNINDLITSLTEFAHSLLLCNVTEIEETKAGLHLKLKNYIEKVPESGDASPDLEALRTLFNFVIKDIYSEMKPLLTGKLPDMILWCKNHDYIQQALTFFNELLPAYLVTNGILKPAAAEEAQYDAFLKRLASAPGDATPNDFLKYSAVAPKNSARYCYDWFSYYMRDMSDPDRRVYLSFAPECALLKTRPATAKIEQIFRTPGRPVLSEKCWGKKETGNPFPKALRNTKNIIALTFSAPKRGFAPRANSRDLAELILIYFILKEQRNAANHAGDAKNKISYEKLSLVLENTAKFLKTI